MTATDARAAYEAHRAVCSFRPDPSNHRSGSSVCGTCWSLGNAVVVAERKEEG